MMLQESHNCTSITNSSDKPRLEEVSSASDNVGKDSKTEPSHVCRNTNKFSESHQPCSNTLDQLPNKTLSSSNVSMMPLPLSVPFSGLTTIPLAICPLAEGENNLLQSNGPQARLVLLNMHGTTSDATGFPQMVCNTSIQQMTESNTTTIHNSNITFQQPPLTTQSRQLSSNIVALTQVSQFSMQSSVIPPSTPAAYVLVPIHSISNQSIAHQQKMPNVNQLINQAHPAITVQSSDTSNKSASESISTTGSFSPSPFYSQSVSNSFNTTSSLTLRSDSFSSHSNTCYFESAGTHSTSNKKLSVAMENFVSDNPKTNDEHSKFNSNLQERKSTILKQKILVGNLNDPGPSTSHVCAPTYASTSSPSNHCSIIEPLKVGEKRKKGPAPKLDGNEKCLVCADKASGYHYGVLSCEGCKGFFRRCVMKNSTYQCRNDGECQMDAFMRRKCPACRLKKCRAVGMKDENFFPELNSGLKLKRTKKDSFDSSSNSLSIEFISAGERPPTLTSHQRNVVEMLQANENRYQWPLPEDVEKVTPWIETGDSPRSRSARFAHFTELAILIVQLVVEFTKQLPGFMSVSREDQIVLLKACTIEVMLLRAAKQYDKKTKAINFLNGKYYDKSSFYRAGMQVEFVDPIFDFCKSMAELGLDEAEYALLVAINTFSTDRPNLKDLIKIEAVQDSYVELLRAYLKIHHPLDPLMFPRTLMKLVQLRTLNNYHSEQIFALKVQDKQLPPLLAEIWDM